jgi:hypothetical protein
MLFHVLFTSIPVVLMALGYYNIIPQESIFLWHGGIAIPVSFILFSLSWKQLKNQLREKNNSLFKRLQRDVAGRKQIPVAALFENEELKSEVTIQSKRKETVSLFHWTWINVLIFILFWVLA